MKVETDDDLERDLEYEIDGAAIPIRPDPALLELEADGPRR